MNNTLEVVVGVQVMVLVAFAVLLYKRHLKAKFLEDKYSEIINIDSEVDRSKNENTRIQEETGELRASYKDKKAIFDKLVREAAIYDEEIQLAELGFYKPHFDFDTAEKYKERISLVKSRQKQMISNKTAVYCPTEWQVEGSKTKGRTMTNRSIRLTARAFNNECDSAIANARWNNADRMEQRISKAFDAINKLNESTHVEISGDYLSLKLDELRLTHEHKEKKQQEKEEQSEIRQQMREEAKLEKEMSAAIKEEAKYEELLARAKLDAEQVSGSKLEKLQEKIDALNQDLVEAHAKSERAKSMAEQTRIGHVYVISNLGSFGENVYKIGMTRRLEPLERVKELGDASVPFVFDVHAMVYSDDAPAMEKALHKSFHDRRLNLVNNRKEFFRVDLPSIEAEVTKISPEAEFVETAEARQYHESQAIRAQRSQQAERSDVRDQLPEAI